jgi:hypothetical protein
MMRRCSFALGILLTGFSQPLFAALPTISCQFAAEKSFTFEEGIDDYLIDFKERNLESSLVKAFVGTADAQYYTFSVRVPKVVHDATATRPTCRFDSELPLLFNCGVGAVTGKIKLKETGSGKEQEFSAGVFYLANQIQNRTALDLEGNKKREEALKFAFRLYADGTRTPGVIQYETEFALDSCRAGENSESPSR